MYMTKKDIFLDSSIFGLIPKVLPEVKFRITQFHLQVHIYMHNISFFRNIVSIFLFKINRAHKYECNQLVPPVEQLLLAMLIFHSITNDKNDVNLFKNKRYF